MVKPFKLAWPIGRSDAMDKDDIENTKQALDVLGLYEPPQLFTERFSTAPMIRGLKKFQRREGLTPDGVMNPDGPTHRRMNAALERDSDSGTPELNDTPSLTSNKSLQTSIAINKPVPEEIGGQPFEKGRETEFTDTTKTLEKTDKEIESKGVQTAAVPVAVPFAVWLMEFVGAASIVAAMANYNSWSKSKQKSVRTTYEAQKQDEDSFCQQRLDDEFDRCLTLDQKWWHDCIERAQHRFRLCIRNGGEPHPDEPGEWDEGDMEVSPRR